MQTITVSKGELLAVLNVNRNNHREVFEAAIAGFRESVVDRLAFLIRQLERKGQIPSLYIDLPTPEDHTKDYDRVIKMIEMHIGDTFELTEKDFQGYVMDDWNWKRQFLDTSKTYAAATVTQVYGENTTGED